MEVAGLAIGVVGLAGLFSACIESLDIVVNIQHFSEDFDLLCAQLALQRVRLLLWGESLGLVSSPSGKSVPYNHGIDRSDIQPAIKNALNQICLLLQKADVVTDKYELKSASEECRIQTESSNGMAIFRATFEAFKAKLRKNQKQKSNWALTKWSVHDTAKFKDLIERLRGLIDSLEDITNALGVLEQQHARLAQEIESISDTRSLRLLQDASSSNASSQASRLVAETASHRLDLIGGSSRSGGWSSIYKETTSSQSNQSYYTARSTLEINANRKTRKRRHIPDDVLELEGSTTEFVIRSRPSDVLNDFSLGGSDIQQAKTPHSSKVADMATNQKEKKSKKTNSKSTDIPQNQRMMAALVKRAKATGLKPELRFHSEAKDYGNALSAVRATDEELWLQGCKTLLTQANNSVSIAQHVFLELRSIRRAAVPFISASPVKDELDKVLASIEGPLDTPYAGGVFWISVRFLKAGHPPLLRFQTRIFHPNIDCTGKICADYKAWWKKPELRRHVGGTQWTYGKTWFSSRHSNYSLGAVLTALCGLLASPNIEDPLVPEIAEMYLKHYDGYCKAAKLYTERYADGSRPDSDNIVFADPEDGDGASPVPLTELRTAARRGLPTSSLHVLSSMIEPHDKQRREDKSRDDTDSKQVSYFQHQKHGEEKTDSRMVEFERQKHSEEETDQEMEAIMSVLESERKRKQKWKANYNTTLPPWPNGSVLYPSNPY